MLWTREPIPGYFDSSHYVHESCDIHESFDICVHMQSKIDESLASTNEHTQVYLYFSCGMYGSGRVTCMSRVKHILHMFLFIHTYRLRTRRHEPPHAIAHMYIYIVRVAYMSVLKCMSCVTYMHICRLRRRIHQSQPASAHMYEFIVHTCGIYESTCMNLLFIPLAYMSRVTYMSRVKYMHVSLAVYELGDIYGLCEIYVCMQTENDESPNPQATCIVD